MTAVGSETAWKAGSLGGCAGPPRLIFGHMYEDAEIEWRAFQGKDRVFCIASAGATALRLAERHEVVACDVNPVQLAYAERRARGFPAEIGEAERAMNFARALMPLMGWRVGVLREFLALSDVAEQSAFWREHLDNWRLRAAFNALMSPAILRAVYAPRFLSFLPTKFSATLRGRLARSFARHPNASNPYARLLLLGETCDEPLPATPNIRFLRGDAASVLESCPAGFFDGFALSNILDGAESSYRARLSCAVRHAASERAIVVLRSFAEPDSEAVTNHARCDRAMLWGIVQICPAQAF